MEKYIPIILIIFDVLAAIVYIIHKQDYARSIYWVSAALLTASVTFTDRINFVLGGK